MTDTGTTSPTDEELAAFREFQAQQSQPPEAPAIDKAAPEEPSAEAKEPRNWFVAGNTFVYPGTEEGDIRIRLQFKFKLLRTIRAKGIDEVDQLIALLDGIGDTKTLAQLDELDALSDIPKIVDAFFTAFQEKNEASVGEPSRSSN